MKQKNMIFKIMVLFLALAAVISSCKKEDSGAPTVTNIRSTDPAFADISLGTVGLGQIIAIQGTFLETTKSVTINNFPVIVNPAYATNSNIIITVPDETPTLATDPDVPNELVIETEYGVTTIPLVVLPPPPVVNKISNEFAKAGETFIITGKYFYFINSINFPGDVVVTDFTSSADGTTITVTVPDGVGIGEVFVNTASGEGSSGPAYKMGDRTGIVCNFDDLNPFKAWGTLPVRVDPNSNPTPAPLDGYYLRILSGGEILPGSWWNNDWVMPLEGVQSLPISGPASNFGLKFEMYVPETWNSGWFEMNFGWFHFYRWREWAINQPVDEYWGNASGERTNLTTSGWRTVLIPINLFRQKAGVPGGDPVGNVEDILGKDIIWAFQNPDGPDGITLEKLHVCIDNIRIVKIK
ncbi:MAG: glycan-binding surface protein [Bacteroidales bacterium]|nr:glycan-binding surface protein [Bacteroidales bacterium]